MRTFSVKHLFLVMFTVMTTVVTTSCDTIDDDYSYLSPTGCRPSIKHVNIWATYQGLEGFNESATIGIYAWYSDDDKQYNVPVGKPSQESCPTYLYDVWGYIPYDIRRYCPGANDVVTFNKSNLKTFRKARDTRYFAYYPYDSTTTLEDSIVKRELILNSRPKWTDPSTGITYFRGDCFEENGNTMHIFFWF